jgi:hypothetical protein
VHKEVHKKAMHLILVGVLGVDGATVDVIHDVVDGKEIIGTPTQHSPWNVEVGHLLLGHWLVLKVNLEEVDVIVGEIIANAPSKILPRGLHHKLLGHPLHRAEAILIFKKHHGCKELTYHLLGVVVGEGHQGNKTLLFAYLKCLPKVFGLRVELAHVDGVLEATIELL